MISEKGRRFLSQYMKVCTVYERVSFPCVLPSLQALMVDLGTDRFIRQVCVGTSFCEASPASFSPQIVFQPNVVAYPPCAAPLLVVYRWMMRPPCCHGNYSQPSSKPSSRGLTS